jgi:hypothetical protein
MVTIPGKIVRGLGAASQTIRLQMPHLVRVCPELQACKIATINVILECQLEVASPDFLVGPIDWTGSGGPGELFGLLKIRFELVDPKVETDAWLYIPYGSPHRLNPYYAEILAPTLQRGDCLVCKIHLNAAKLIV